MAFIQLAATLLVMGFLYLRMIKREVPSPVKAPQAIVPVVLGVISVLLSFGLFLGIGYGLKGLGYSSEGQSMVLHSVTASFFMAGLPEETMKFLMMLVTILIFKKKIRNVYELILIGTAVGFGFAMFEEFNYGSASIVTNIIRLLTVPAHSIFGIIMMKHLGTAVYNKRNGLGHVGQEILLGILLPIAIHTLFDSCNGNNMLLRSEDNKMVVIGMVISFAAFAAMFALQVVLLVRMKKQVGKYCAMQF